MRADLDRAQGVLAAEAIRQLEEECAHLENRLGFLTGRSNLRFQTIATWIRASFCKRAVGCDASCVRVSSFHRGLVSIYALWVWL